MESEVKTDTQPSVNKPDESEPTEINGHSAEWYEKRIRNTINEKPETIPKFGIGLECSVDIKDYCATHTYTGSIVMGRTGPAFKHKASCPCDTGSAETSTRQPAHSSLDWSIHENEGRIWNSNVSRCNPIAWPAKDIRVTRNLDRGDSEMSIDPMRY